MSSGKDALQEELHKEILFCRPCNVYQAFAHINLLRVVTHVETSSAMMVNQATASINLLVLISLELTSSLQD